MDEKPKKNKVYGGQIDHDYSKEAVDAFRQDMGDNDYQAALIKGNGINEYSPESERSAMSEAKNEKKTISKVRKDPENRRNLLAQYGNQKERIGDLGNNKGESPTR